VDVVWDAADHLPDAAVQISVVVFGALTLLFLCGGVFLARRRHHRTPPSPPSFLADMILAERIQRGFDGDPIGQAVEEGGESGPPRD
jgi:hypothetical protein